MIAWPSTSMLLTMGASMPPGRSPRTRSTASFTSCTALSVGTSMRNSTEVVDRPSVTDEKMFFTPLMPAMASSTSFVTWASISEGAAPGWATDTATSGTSMFGKRVTGRPLNDCQPRNVRITKARIGATGLRIDQAEKFIGAPVSSRPRPVRAAGLPGRRRGRRRRP